MTKKNQETETKISVTRQRTISLTGFESESVAITATCTLVGNSIKTSESGSVTKIDPDFEKEVQEIDKKISHMLDKKEYFIRKQVVDNDWFENESYKEKYDLVKKRLMGKSKKSKGKK